jgi:hypothetical protein
MGRSRTETRTRHRTRRGSQPPQLVREFRRRTSPPSHRYHLRLEAQIPIGLPPDRPLASRPPQQLQLPILAARHLRPSSPLSRTGRQDCLAGHQLDRSRATCQTRLRAAGRTAAMRGLHETPGTRGTTAMPESPGTHAVAAILESTVIHVNRGTRGARILLGSSGLLISHRRDVGIHVIRASLAIPGMPETPEMAETEETREIHGTLEK